MKVWVPAMEVKFTVLGEPQGKGRPKFSRRGNFVKTYTPDKTVLYENLICIEYQRQCSGQRFPDKEPLAMKITAYYTIPASASKKRQQFMEAGRIRPTKKPDMDNIIKVVADALNKVAYRDDTDIVRISLEKFYDRQPRIEIEIKTMEE